MDGREALPTGIDSLDALLPSGGLHRGTLVEWLAEGEGAGAETLALIAATQATRSGGALVVVDHRQTFYPPAAAALGRNLDEIVLVRPRTAGDALWALEQSLRCPGAAVVLCRLDRLHNRGVRRLQLAAETGGTIGFLMRPAAVRSLPSWADVRLLVTPLPSSTPSGRRLRLEIIRCRKGTGGGAVDVEINHETGSVRPVSPLAPATSAGRSAGA